MDRNIQADLEEYRKQKTQSGVAPLTAPTGTRNITADLEAYRLKKDKPKTYAEKSAEMQSQGQAVATKGRFNRTGEITPSLGGNIVRGIAKIPVKGALTVARGFGGLVSDKISDEGLTVKSKFLGDTKDIATIVEDDAKRLADRANKGEISKGRAIAGAFGSALGETLDLASVIPAGAVLSAGKTAVAQGAKGVARESIKGATKTALKRSGTMAGAYDIAQQAKEGEGYNPLRTAGAVALGTVADVGLSNVLPRVVSPRKKTVDEEIRKIFEGTTGDVATIENSASRAKKGLELLIKESKDLEIPDNKAPLGSGATKVFNIKNSKPNELLSGVVEIGKKITARARQATEKARQAGLRLDTKRAEQGVQSAIDSGRIPKATGERLIKQIRETNGDPVKIHDWVENVNKDWKTDMTKAPQTKQTAEDIAKIFREDLDTIVDRKGYAEAFGNNQELKKMLIAIAKKANKQVNFGDISSDAGIDAAISILTGNPAYMARTVGTTLFKGLIGRIRNKSGIKALKRSIKKQSKLPTSQKLPSSEVKPQKPILQLPAGRKESPRVRLESGKTINLPSRVQSTVDKQEIAKIQSTRPLPVRIQESIVPIPETFKNKVSQQKISELNKYITNSHNGDIEKAYQSAINADNPNSIEKLLIDLILEERRLKNVATVLDETIPVIEFGKSKKFSKKLPTIKIN
jgi:hypothetical protein